MSSSGWGAGSSSGRGSSRGGRSWDDDEPPWSRDWGVSRGGGTYRPGAERRDGAGRSGGRSGPRGDAWSGASRRGAQAPERPPARGGRPAGRDEVWVPPARGGGLWGNDEDDPRLRGRQVGSAGSSGRHRAAASRGGPADPRAARGDRRGYGVRGNQGARYRRGNGAWGAYDEDERSSGMSSGTAFGIIVGALLLGGGAGYAYWHFTTPKVANSSGSPSSDSTPTSAPTATPSATPRTPTATPHALAPGDGGRRIVWVRWPDAS